MIISVNWLKKYLPTDVDIHELTDKIGARLVEIESVQNLGDKYRASKATIAKVISCIKHPNSDHLHICQIDDGGVNDVPRDEDGYVQVVCGAPNVRTGLMVAWLPPTAIVPESYGTDDEFKLSARKLRGVLSQGMLASPRELDLWNEHEGIMEVDDPVARPGMSLMELLDLDDYLLEVENKSLTHRPDCFGMIGFAREVAAILEQEANIPAWFNNLGGTVKIDDSEVEPTVAIADDKICQRYECIALDLGDGQARELPLVMRSLIGRSGSNSVSAPVDITNYLMYETGQPLHAFDLDKLIALSSTGRPDMVVRLANAGEKLALLDGREIDLDPADIIIAVGDADNSLPVALAGAMGGLNSEITSDTKRVLLESATFDLYHLRGTQFRHGVFSEAITRFTKGQPAGLTHPVLLQAVQMMRDYTNASVISNIAAAGSVANNDGFAIPVDDFTNVLGYYQGRGYDADLIMTTLNNLQYSDVHRESYKIMATAPWWRTDLHINEDVIEDVGRVNGYDDITSSLPRRPYTAAPYNQLYQKQMWLRERLKEAGGNEVVTYSFVHGDLLDKVGDDKTKAFRIVNAISPNLQYYRRDLLPGLVELARDNLRSGYDNFLLFELGKVHRQGLMDESESLPAEIPEVSGIVVNKASRSNSAFYTIKKVLTYALDIDSAEVELVRLDQAADRIQSSDLYPDGSLNIFEPKRSAALLVNKQLAGVAGEFATSVRKAFKLPDFAAGFSLYTKVLLPYLDDGSVYTPVLRYQGTSRDITYQVDNNVTYGQVLDFTTHMLAAKEGDNVVTKVVPKDIYDAGDGKRNITLHIDFHDRTQTVNAKMVGKLMDKLAHSAEHELDAKVI